MIIFTSVNRAYLSKAQLLATSVKAHIPNATFVLALLDDLPSDSNTLFTVFDRVLLPEDLEIKNFESWIFTHSVVEACTAQKGRVLLKLLRDYPDQPVVYLDPDIEVYSNLIELEAALDKSDVVLTPHLTIPETTDGGIQDNEMAALIHGAYNLGFLAVNNTQNGFEFANWWDSRLMSYCYDEKNRGLFTDQKWIDLAPGLFDGVHILKHPGYNLATWNISQRHLSLNEGQVHVNDLPLRFVHYSGYDSGAHIQMLQKYAKNQPLFLELSNEYSKRLNALEQMYQFEKEWAYGNLSNGDEIKAEWRRIYRDSKPLQKRFNNPFKLNKSHFGQDSRTSKIPLIELATNRSLWRNNYFVAGVHEMFVKFSTNSSESNPYADILKTFNDGEHQSFESISDVTRFDELHRFKGLLDSTLPTVLHIGHGLGGGSDMHIEQIASLGKFKANHLRLLPISANNKAFSISLLNRDFNYDLTVNSTQPSVIIDLLEFISVSVVHVHHVMNIEELVETIGKCGKFEIVVTLHDYYFLTPNWIFDKGGGDFLDFPTNLSELQLINRDLDDEVIGRWVGIDRWIKFLENAKLLILPSASTYKDFSNFIDMSNAQVIPHPEFPHPELSEIRFKSASESNDELRVGVFGDIGIHKGSEIVKRVMQLAPSKISFIGFGKAHPSLIGLFDEWCGEYNRVDLLKLFEIWKIDLLLLPMQINETYSYSLSEALQSGLPIVASDIPVFKERAEHRPNVTFVPKNSNEDEWLEAIKSSSKQTRLTLDPCAYPYENRNKYKSIYWA